MCSVKISRIIAEQRRGSHRRKEIVMALDDYLEPEVAIAVAVTAAVASPPVRKVLRRGLVYGLAGLLVAGDKIAGTAREIAKSAQETVAPASTAGHETEQAAPPSRVVTA
jgi:hypothetical protein